MATKCNVEVMQERRIVGTRLLKRNASHSEVARQLGVPR